MSARRVVVVDTETTGLNPARHVAVEVAWHDLSTGDTGRFVPRHSWLDRWRATPKALQINGYAERLRNEPQDRGPSVTDLWVRLQGATLAGSNPTFDAQMLAKVFRRYGWPVREPWHHRLADLAAYAGGRLGIDPGELPGLAAVCERLDVAAPDHTAAGDVRATVECFRKLEAMTSCAGLRAEAYAAVAELNGCVERLGGREAGPVVGDIARTADCLDARLQQGVATR